MTAPAQSSDSGVADVAVSPGPKGPPAALGVPATVAPPGPKGPPAALVKPPKTLAAAVPPKPGYPSLAEAVEASKGKKPGKKVVVQTVAVVLPVVPEELDGEDKEEEILELARA